jgi:hypothetical protein
MKESRSFARCLQRTAGEFTAIALNEPVPLNPAVTLGQPWRESRMQIPYLTKGESCRKDIHEAHTVSGLDVE